MKNEVQGITAFTYKELCNIIKQYCLNIINNLELDIKDVQLHGSRLREDAKETSDLDAVIEYIGNYKEYALFNLLNHAEELDKLKINNILVDINPIRKEESGTMKEYMKRSKEYDLNVNNN